MQVHLYLAEADHPAHGTVRAIVKDDNDTYLGENDQVWLDSGALPAGPAGLRLPCSGHHHCTHACCSCMGPLLCARQVQPQTWSVWRLWLQQGASDM